MVIVDGHSYAKRADAPDLGSLTCVSADGGQRNYKGLSSDYSKLPTYNDLETGSWCLMIDNNDFYQYNASNKTWYKA